MLNEQLPDLTPEILGGIRALVFADNPAQTQIDEIRQLRATLQDDHKLHMSVTEVEKMPTHEWLGLDPQDRERILKENREEMRTARANAPKETDQQRRERIFDAQMKEHQDELAATYERVNERKAALRAQWNGIGSPKSTPRPETVAERATRMTNESIARVTKYYEDQGR